MEEDFESVNEDEQGIPESTPVSEIWLEAVVIGILFRVKSLGKHSPSDDKLKTAQRVIL